MPPHPADSAFQQLSALTFRNLGIVFPAQITILFLFLQQDKGKVVIVIPYPEFLPYRSAVRFLPQRFVRKIVKINTAYQIAALRTPMGIRLRHSPKTALQLQVLGVSDAVF